MVVGRHIGLYSAYFVSSIIQVDCDLNQTMINGYNDEFRLSSGGSDHLQYLLADGFEPA
jgi:hypothetical protein